MSQILQKAREYEQKRELEIGAEERPEFHLSARVGWMNDPNGFSYFKGKYHMFYQYHPYGINWGPMHWGHAVSTDLLHWEHLPVAIAPDTPYDKEGCFSGSAIELADGRQLLMYTGVSKEVSEDNSVRELQRQCVALGDGLDYEKMPDNPVLDSKSLPQGASQYDFRDPKIWQEADGTYRCVVGNCTADRDGQVLLFQSEDALHWKFHSILAKNDKRFGTMWECPDFFELDNKYVLIVSPQDMLAKDLEYSNGNGTLCLIGEYVRQTGNFKEEYDQTIDYGMDFYAPQTVLTPDGRRVMVAWMQNWDTCNLRTSQRPWFGQLSLPRELSVKEGRLYQQPVRELEKLRVQGVRYSQMVFSDFLQLEGVRGRKVDMELTIAPGDDMQMYRKLTIYFAQDEKNHASISYSTLDSIVRIDRKFAGSRRAVIHQRQCLAASDSGRIKLRIILDAFSAEVFVNGGEQVLTFTYYTDLKADGISFKADGCVVMDLACYELSLK